jgi:hypothetical protein
VSGRLQPYRRFGIGLRKLIESYCPVCRALIAASTSTKTLEIMERIHRCGVANRDQLSHESNPPGRTRVRAALRASDQAKDKHMGVSQQPNTAPLWPEARHNQHVTFITAPCCNIEQDAANAPPRKSAHGDAEAALHDCCFVRTAQGCGAYGRDLDFIPENPRRCVRNGQYSGRPRARGGANGFLSFSSILARCSQMCVCTTPGGVGART